MYFFHITNGNFSWFFSMFYCNKTLISFIILLLKMKEKVVALWIDYLTRFPKSSFCPYRGNIKPFTRSPSSPFTTCWNSITPISKRLTTSLFWNRKVGRLWISFLWRKTASTTAIKASASNFHNPLILTMNTPSYQTRSTTSSASLQNADGLSSLKTLRPTSTSSIFLPIRSNLSSS